MAFQFVQLTWGYAGAGTPRTASTDQGNTNYLGADFLVLAVAQANGTPDPAITDNQPGNTWRKVIRYQGDTNSSITIYYAQNAQVNNNFVVNANNPSNDSYFGLLLLGLKGGITSNNLVSAVDFTGTNSAPTVTSINPSSSTIVPLALSELIILAMSFSANITSGTIAVVGEYNWSIFQVASIPGQSYGVMLGLQVQGPIVSINPLLGWTGSDSVNTAVATFQSQEALILNYGTLLGDGLT